MNSNPFEPIYARLTNLEGLTLEVLQLLRSHAPATPAEDTYLPAQEAADFLDIALQTLYQNKTVKRTKRFGKLYFLKSDLVSFLESGKGVATK